MQRMAAIAVVFFILFSKTVAQDSAPAKPYDVAEAYQIYSLLIPHEESYGFAKDTLMIREETVSMKISRADLTPDAANKFMDTIAVFNRINSRKWLLQRRFQIQKSYTLISAATIKNLPDQPPSSAAYVEMSVVAFNHERTRAIVYLSNSCGGLCGSFRFHLLEKRHGKWKEVPGVTSVGFS